MEVIIPPRDHGQTTYRYTWDDNGEVQRVERVSESIDYTSSRQTVQWPFQGGHARTETLASEATHTTAEVPRRATWQPAGLLRGEDSPSSIEKDLIPDYVINYLRGETPETLARKKAERQRRGPQNVDLERQQHQHRSRAADFYSEASSSGRSGSLTSSEEDEERMISRGGKKRRSSRGDEPVEKGFRRLTTGWRGGVLLNTLVSFLILVVTIVCLTMAIARAQMLGGEETVYAGACARASAVNWGLHVVINALVVALIAIANYVFQILSAPTRAELGTAHEMKRWLDIGVPSVRNLMAVSVGRVMLVAVLVFVAVGTQIIYNAVIFTSRTGIPYDLLFVTPEFLTGAPFSNATSNNQGMLDRLDILSLQDRAGRGQLVNLTTAECVGTFGGAFESDFAAVIVVTNLATSPGSSLIQTGVRGSSLSLYVSEGTPGGPDGVSMATIPGSSVRFCLAQPHDDPARADPQCSVTLNGSLLGIVALLNLVSVIVVASLLAWTRFHPLVTLGDAIASFLYEPDHTTRGTCLLSKADIRGGRWGFREAKYWLPQEHLWLNSPSIVQWIGWAASWLLPAALGAAALAVSTRDNPSGALTAFGEASPHVVYTFAAGTSRAGIALITALPQVLLAVLYLMTNNLLTTYFLSHELSRFALPGAAIPLRVSSRPEGAQTTGLYLTLPRPFSWLLLVVFAALGFLLSQSVVVVSVDFSPLSSSSSSGDANSPSEPISPPVSGIGFSGVALLAFLTLLVLLAALVVGLGMRRADTSATSFDGHPAGNPLVLPGGSCSAVLSARCHRVRGDGEAARKPVAWGVVNEGTGMNAGHATFSSRPVTGLNLNRTYA